MKKHKSNMDTIEQFLARGGKITVCDPILNQEEKHVIMSSQVGPVTILTYDDAELLYGEAVKPSKKRKTTKININDLPESIRNAYLKGVIDV